MKAHIIKEDNVIDINELRSNERVSKVLEQNELLESVFEPIFSTIEEEGAEDGGLRVLIHYEKNDYCCDTYVGRIKLSSC